MIALEFASMVALAIALSAAQPDSGTAGGTVQTPFQNEALRYSVNWPSGLSLGEAQLQSSFAQKRWSFAFSLDASIPGFAASGTYGSVAVGDFCSSEFTKQFTHGKRKANERTVFEPQRGTARRETMGVDGGSEINISACPRDALTFLYFVRRELADGRLPGPQTVYFGAPYQVKLEFGGKQSVRVNDTRMDADRVIATLKGPASQATVELFFARDEGRTLLMAKLPLSSGTFSLELVR